MLSELVIASTLFVNACAVLNFKLTELLFQKTLTTVPAGRPRSSADKARQENLGREADEDDHHIDSILQQLRVELDVKRREEERLQKEIAGVLVECASGNSGGEQSRAFGMAVSRLNNAMLVVEADAKQLAASLRTISRLADNISGKVSALDVAKTRVVECLQLAGDMHDLGSVLEIFLTKCLIVTVPFKD
ncbi:hypothetical protein NECAME_04919 [Necator americanus]|uniref:Conserved oligomeric Golgi complex subunit 4 N-terminal domain-containing protein n=1 Tax=Necator americanus TaxID=51031 RepID=W2SNP6_NECAM|nr:hypothetical protein NECAME_04919 [Necator americanus]ETN70496.1 hypothetical protein NECAME_04919 [Necator americanus]